MRLLKPSSKSIGTDNEKIMDQLARFEDIAVVPIPDGCRQINAHRLIRVKSPFDRILAKGGAAAFVDYKSCEKAPFSYSQVNLDQVIYLKSLHDKGLVAGYMVHFRQEDTLVFFNAQALFNLKPRTSLSAASGISLGSLFAPKISNIFCKEAS